MCHLYSLCLDRVGRVSAATCHWLVTCDVMRSVTPCIPGYPHLHFPGDWYIPPPHTSGPIRGRVEACWPIRGRYVVSRCQCVGTQTKVLCCDQRRVPGWDDEIKHSQMGLHFSQFLIALCISYSLTFVRLIGFVAWMIPTNYSWIFQLSNVWYIHCLRRSKCLMHICRQMSRISCIFLFNQTF